MKLTLLCFWLLCALLSPVHAQSDPGAPNAYFGQQTPSAVKTTGDEPASSFTDDALSPAQYLVTAADDFVVEVYLNGKLVPASQREQLAEIFGAIAEKDKIIVKPGDWVVFNVVNDQMRWGTCYFGVAGMTDDGKPVFVSKLNDPRWTCCDDPGKVAEFIAQKDSKGEPIQHIANVWADGLELMRNHAFKDWNGDPIWGKSHNTWIKFVYR